MTDLNFYTIEEFTSKEVVDEVALAKTYEGALALAFGGEEKDYIENNNAKHAEKSYVIECNGTYKYFQKY